MIEDAEVKWARLHHGWWALAIAAFLAIYWNGILELVDQWDREVYSYAYLIPPLCAWLIWQRRKDIAEVGPKGSWAGLIILAASLLIALIGQLSTTNTLVFYGLLMTVFGLAVAQIGWRGVRIIAGPLGCLFFMIPLPAFLHDGLSAEMQLLSARLGVLMLRALGVDVYLEDNLIDLGAYQVEVAEACDGLRYLFPLLSLAYLIALLYRGGLWSRLVIFVSAVPLTLFINSGRIAITGLLVRYVTVAAAEGFLHFFESWLLFLFGVILLFAEVPLLSRLTGHRGSLRSLLRLELLGATRPEDRASSVRNTPQQSGAFRALPFSTLSAIVLLAVMAVGMNILPTRAGVEVAPSRLASFPLWINGWLGSTLPADRQFEKLAQEPGINDFVLAEYRRVGGSDSVNLCIAYYGTLNRRVVRRPPPSCMPAEGSRIVDIEKVSVDGISGAAGTVTVNRAVIGSKNKQKLVYYWFEQRGRQMANEYIVSWMIFWDRLTKNRTDGALVQLTTGVPIKGDFVEADARIASFLRSAYADIAEHVAD